MANETLSISIIAELGDLKKQLQEAGGLSEAQAQRSVIALEKRIAKANKLAEAAAKNAKKAADAAADLDKRVGGAVKSVEKLGAIGGGVFGDLGGLVGDVNDLLEGLAAVGGPAGVGVALAGGMALVAGSAVAAAAAVYSLEQSAVAAQDALLFPAGTRDAVADIALQMQTSAEATSQFQVSAGLLANVLGGDLVDEMTGFVIVGKDLLDLEIEVVRQTDAFASSVGSASLAVGTLGASLAADGLKGALQGVGESLFGHADLLDLASDRAAESTTQIKALTAAEQAYGYALSDAERDEQSRTEARKKLEDNEKKAAAEQEKRRAAAAAAEAKRLADAASASAAYSAQLAGDRDAEARTLMAVAATVEQYAETYAAAQRTATEAVAARVATEIEEITATVPLYDQQQALITAALAQGERDRAAIVVAEGEKAIAAAESGVAEASSRSEDIRSAQLDLASATVSGVEDLSGAFLTMAREGSAAYAALFAASKVAALAQVAVNTAVGISAALALPPPADVLKGAAVIVGGAAAAATIVATTIQQAPAVMATGGFAGPPDHFPAMLSHGEAVLTQRATAALGRDRVEALNRGEAGAGGGTVVARQSYGVRTLSTVVVDLSRRDTHFRRNMRNAAKPAGKRR